MIYIVYLLIFFKSNILGSSLGNFLNIKKKYLLDDIELFSCDNLRYNISNEIFYTNDHAKQLPVVIVTGIFKKYFTRK